MLDYIVAMEDDQADQHEGQEKEIQDKMMEIYDAYTGSKAAEMAKRE